LFTFKKVKIRGTMEYKFIRINKMDWKKLKDCANENESTIIKVFNEIMSGVRDSQTMELKQ
jgi:hypothetical protein